MTRIGIRTVVAVTLLLSAVALAEAKTTPMGDNVMPVVLVQHPPNVVPAGMPPVIVDNFFDVPNAAGDLTGQSYLIALNNDVLLPEPNLLPAGVLPGDPGAVPLCRCLSPRVREIARRIFGLAIAPIGVQRRLPLMV